MENLGVFTCPKIRPARKEALISRHGAMVRLFYRLHFLVLLSTHICLYRPNACAPRTINTRSGDPIFLHTSVFLFLQTKAEKEGYVPAAIWHSSEKGVSPYIGDGVQLHRIGKTDCDREVRKRLKVSWDTPEEQEIWWNPSTWTWGSIIVPVDTLDNLKDVMRAAGAIRRAMYI